MKPRTLPQNKAFHALVRDIAAARPLLPWRRPIAQEGWKRFLLALYVREARMEAYGTGQADPFPARAARSRDLASWQMDELLECAHAFAAQNLNLAMGPEN